MSGSFLSTGTTTVQYRYSIGLNDMHWNDVGADFREISTLITPGDGPPINFDDIRPDLTGDKFSIAIAATITHTPNPQLDSMWVSLDATTESSGYVNAVPEPATVVLLGIGLAGLCGGGGYVRRRLKEKRNDK